MKLRVRGFNDVILILQGMVVKIRVNINSINIDEISFLGNYLGAIFGV